MKECPFCQNNKERLLFETDRVKVIFSDPRLTEGHLLVIPKRHVEELWNLSDAELKEILSQLKVLQKKISKTIGTGCDIRQNYRPFLNQNKLKVDHLHFHLIPRTFEDEIYHRTQKDEVILFKDLEEREVKKVSRLLKE